MFASFLQGCYSEAMTTAEAMIYIFVGCFLFVSGVGTGIFLTRKSREVITREVPRIVETERVVEHEKPVIVQIPAPQTTQGGPVKLGGNHTVLSEQELAGNRHMQELIRETNPEI